jgi:hypothetical protein
METRAAGTRGKASTFIGPLQRERGIPADPMRRVYADRHLDESAGSNSVLQGAR